MTKKKIIALMLSALLAISVTGCTKASNDNTDNKTTSATEQSDYATDDSVNIGDFNTTDINGNEVNKDIFKEYDLTVINVWTTWCTYCIQEMPHLAELSDELKDDGVQIIGIVDDVKNPYTGEIDKERLELTNTILEKTGVKYPIILPDDVLKNGIMSSISGYPTTYFVDSNGNLVAQPISGALPKAQWQKVINEILNNMEKNK